MDVIVVFNVYIFSHNYVLKWDFNEGVNLYFGFSIIMRLKQNITYVFHSSS